MKLRRIFDLADESDNPDALAFYTNIDSKGKPAGISRNQHKKSIYSVAGHLMREGIRKSNIVITLSTGCMEWNMVDFAIMSLGAIHVALSPTITAPQLNNILMETQPSVIFIQSDFLLGLLESCNYYQFHRISLIPLKHGRGNDLTNLQFILHQNTAKHDIDKIEEIKAEISENDLALISYTSGTGDLLKGVKHTHKSVTEQVEIIAPQYNFNNLSCAFSFLPVNYLYERLFNYIYQYANIPIVYADNTLTLAQNLARFQPGCCAMVPDTLYRLINSGADIDWLKPYLQFFFCSGAPLRNDALDFFLKNGIKIFEHYGSTETLIVALNSHQYFKPGTSGKLLFPNRVQVKEDGRLYYKSSFSGYFNNNKLNSTKIDTDGYYETGDIAEIDREGFLTVKCRAAEIFKKSSGVFINPVDIENSIATLCKVKYVVVYPDGNSRLRAIIVPHKMQEESLIAEALKAYNMKAKSDHVVEGYSIVNDEWGEATGELTSSQKIRRSFIIEKYNLHEH